LYERFVSLAPDDPDKERMQARLDELVGKLREEE
jgi:hypothetical protein